MAINQKNRDFEHLSFHGTKIDGLDLKKGKVTLHLEKVFMQEHHAENTSRQKLCLKNCTLAFTQAVQSDANINIYIPENTLKTHPHITLKPEFDIPIKDLVSITKCEHLKKLTRFLIMGYYWASEYKITGWVKWEIIAADFNFSWESSEPIGQAIPYETEIA